MSATTTLTMKFIKKRLTWCHLKKISIPRIVKHQTIRSIYQQNHLRIIISATSTVLFLDSVISQLDQQFSGHAEAVMRLSLLLLANVVAANFCEVEPAVNLFLPSLQAPLIKVKTQLLL